jgi:hypothetical protein
MIPADTSFQILLRVISAMGLLGGGAMLVSGMGLLKSRRRSRPDKPSNARVAMGAIFMALGSVAFVLNRPPAPEPEVISPTRFSSDTAPTLSLDAPAGWRFTHHREAGKVVATDGASEVVIETARLTDQVDPAGFVKLMADRAFAAGGTVEGPFTDTFDGLTALGIVTRFATQSSALWYVARGGPVITVMVCRVADVANARSTCRNVLATLHWRSPGPL